MNGLVILISRNKNERRQRGRGQASLWRYFRARQFPGYYEEAGGHGPRLTVAALPKGQSNY